MSAGNIIDRFLKLMKDRGASDLHLSVGRPPIFRASGRIEPIRFRVLDNTYYEELIKPITPPHLWKDYLEGGDADFAYEVPGVARYRVNLFKQERGMGAVFRIIPTKILSTAAVHPVVGAGEDRGPGVRVFAAGAHCEVAGTDAHYSGGAGQAGPHGVDHRFGVSPSRAGHAGGVLHRPCRRARQCTTRESVRVLRA